MEHKYFHVTCVLHNTRYSARMFNYFVKSGEPTLLIDEDETKFIEIFCNHIVKFELKLVALNFCKDHVHFIIKCEENNLGNIIGRLKSMTSREYNIWKGKTIVNVKSMENAETMEDAGTMGHAPLSRGKTQNSFWAQKFNRKEIQSESQLVNTIEYICKNRIKHELEELNEESLLLIKKTLSPVNEL